MTHPESFEHLSETEREVVGAPEEYDWDHPIAGGQARTTRSHFSMRIDPALYDNLASLADLRSVRFSDVVRDALETYLGRRTQINGATFTVGGAQVILTDYSSAWTSLSRGVESHLELVGDGPRGKVPNVAVEGAGTDVRP